jgi:hypothetical protein
VLTRHTRLSTLALSIAAALALSATASATPITMPTYAHELALKKAAAAAGVTFPGPPCPENGIANSVIGQVSGAAGVANPGLPIGSCGVAQPVATTLPWPGPMAYYGGHVQTHPREYLVLWGWGDAGAFPGRYCQSETFSEPLADGTTASPTVGCDPDGAAKYMADFLAQMGGTQWAGVSTQYYQTNSDGSQTPVSNDPNVLAGIWVDDGNNPDLSSTNVNNPTGATNTNTDLAAEASRAAAHFGVPDGQALWNANFIIAQPPGFSDPNALNLGYCAFHDYTESDASGNGYYKDPSVRQGILGVSQGISYTNMPYTPLLLGGSCGEDVVNPKPDGGDLDGFSIVLGHEVEETITDPGGEATVGDARNAGPSNAATGGASFFGAWYDATDPNENGDKCAWVGNYTNPETSLVGAELPGSPGDIAGNKGERFPVQSLWSNAAGHGAGYCSGVASTDLPSRVGNGEEGGTAYTTRSTWQLPPQTCNPAHLFVDDSPDATSPFSPSTSNPTIGSQEDQLDTTQADFAVSGGSLQITLTIKNLNKNTTLPTNDNDYQVYWTERSANGAPVGYGADVQVDSLGNVTASDGTMDMSAGAPFYSPVNTLPASDVQFGSGPGGTIVIDVPLSDVGNPQPGSVLGTPGVQTLDELNGNNPVFAYQPGFYADQDGNETGYIIGGSPCV